MEALALQIMVATPATLRRLTSELTPLQWRRRPGAGAWSIVEIVGHLIDKTEAWSERFHRIATEEQPLMPGFDQDARVQERHYQDQDPAGLITRLESLMQATVAELRSLPAEAWNRPGIHQERGRLSLAEACRIYAISLPQHVEQLVLTREAALRPPAS